MTKYDRYCPRCQTWKPRSEFCKDSHAKDGIRIWCTSCCSKAQIERWRANPPVFRERARNYRERVKAEVLTHYGNGKLACVVCGEDRLPCLSIDHINGDGMKELRRLKRRGNSFYLYLRYHKFPEGYQTLCMNCQWVKRYMNKEWHSGAKVD